MALPINHLKRTLDRCCGQWEFDFLDSHCFGVRFLNTGKQYRISKIGDKWQAFDIVDANSPWSNPDARLTGILNGHTRDDAGEVEPIFETPDKVVT